MTEREYARNLDAVLDDIAVARNYNEWIVDRARPYLRGRVLDAGAGTGTFTAALVDLVDEVVALEPDPRFVKALHERFASERRVDPVEGTAESPPDTLGTFDTVVCFNVLEHVPDDERALRALRTLLRPGGVLLLLVPAHPLLAGPLDDTLGHVRRYRRTDLHRRLAAAGFDVDTLRHVNPVGALGWLVRVRVLRRREWPVTSFRLFDMLVPALRPLDRLRLPFGLSLWGVAR